MRRSTVAAFLAALALGSCAEPPADDAPDAEGAAAVADAQAAESAIDALADAWQAAYNTHDAQQVASMYTEDGQVYPADGGGFEGREAIRGWLAGAFADDPTIEIMPGQVHTSGNRGVAMGTYAVTVSPEGADPVTLSGAYMNALERVNGAWAIATTVSNYDQPPPEGMTWNPPLEGDPPPEEDTFAQLAADYESAWNAGDAAAVAALHTPDARVAYADGPILQGRSAVQAAAEERMTPGTTLDIHPVGHEDLGDGSTGQGGWYEIADPEGNVVQTGIWMNLVQVQDDGTPLIRWSVTNARPAGA